MTPHDQSATPIVKFLGEEAGRGGPFALLGLGHDIRSEEQVQRAAMRRLRQIDCHPQRATPDAQEARLAVHSAASQLLDSAMREHLVKTWPEGTPIDLPQAWKPGKAMQRITPALVQRARMLIGASGGWNSVARRRLAHLARLHRISPVEMIQQLGTGTRTRRSGPQALEPSPRPELPDAPSSGASWGVAYGVLGLLAAAVFTTVMIQPLGSRGGSAQGDLNDAVPGLTSMPPQLEPSTVERDRLTHYTAVAHELDRLVTRVRTEPDAAIERFKEVYPQFISSWTEFPEPALKRAGLNIAEFITRLERDGQPAELVAPLLAVATLDPKRVMIASGMIDLTLGSPTLGTDTRAQLRAIRTQMSSAPIDPRVDLHSSLISVASGLAQNQRDDSAEWWTSWLECVAVLDQGFEPVHTQLILDALSQRLRDERTPDDQWRQTSKLLVRALNWREQSQERYWLISQFSESQVQTDRLAILTDALANASAADGVDQLMVLAENANTPQRNEMRDLYTSRWFPGQESQNTRSTSSGSSPVLDGIRVRTNSVGDRLTDSEAIESIVELTRYTSAAMLTLGGNEDLATDVLEIELNASEAVSENLGLMRSAEDDEWALLALNADGAAQARPILDRLLAKESVDISGAYALVELALLKDRELAAIALTHVARLSSKLPVLIAVDHAVMTSSRVSSHLEELVIVTLEDELPSRNSAEWKPLVRSKLLERMGQAIGRVQHHQVTAVQRSLSTLLGYHVTEGGDLELSEMLNRIANQHLRALMDLSNGAGSVKALIDQAQSRAMVLRARSDSPMQLYLVEQQFLLDLLIIEMNFQYPVSQRRLESIREEHERRMQTSSSVIQQIIQTERAIALVLEVALERSPSP